MRKLILIFLIIGTSMNVFCSTKNEIIIREVCIQVLDGDTNLPVPNLTVYNLIKIYRPRGLYILGELIGERKDSYSFHLEKYTTDNEGRLTIPEKKISVSSNQFLDSQTIFINVEFIDSTLTDKEKCTHFYFLYSSHWKNSTVYSPKNEYKTVKILSMPFPMGENFYLLEKDKPYLQYVKNGHEVPELTKKQRKYEPKSFFCGREEFLIKLEKSEIRD